jgi:peptidyl-prolyl cis-trans isomerase SurA
MSININKLILTCCCALPLFTNAQVGVIDKIVAVVGDHIVLQSDVNNTFEEYKRMQPEIDDSMKCGILENILSKNILAEQGAKDSVVVTEEEVEGNLENKLRYFVQQYGSEERMEQVTGKNMYQLKDEYRGFVKDELVANRVQGTIMNGIKITPSEIRNYFDKIPMDSLPTMPSQVEVGQLVITPIASKSVEDYAVQELTQIREQIVTGKSDFETMAGIYGMDGTKDNGGDLGVVSRDDMVPEFSSAAFKLQTGEISNVIKSRFGFHLVQMVKRQGEKAKLRHILIKPKITSEDLKVALAKCDSIRNLITTGKITFNEAVQKFSTDERTKSTGGMFSSPSTGSSIIGQEELEPSVALALAKMQPGEISNAVVFSNEAQGDDKLVRILMLKTITEPHVMNLTQDYSRIQQAALSEKQNAFLMKWIEEKIGDFYIKIDTDYQSCTNIAKWQKNNKN